MSGVKKPFAPGIAHQAWRLLPANFRRSVLSHATSWLAPRPDRHPPPVLGGLAVGGELSRASGIGETARLMIRAARELGLPVWPVDIPPPVDQRIELPAHAASEQPPPGAPLVLHINAPSLPLALLRLPRSIMRERLVIGYWAWELPAVPPEWRIGARFVHEIWAPSAFTAAALEPLMPGRVRVVPPPLAMVPTAPSNLTRAAFGLPEDAVVVLVSFNLASSFVRKNPLGAIAAFRDAFGDRSDRVLVMKIGHADHAPDDFALLVGAAQGGNIRILTDMLPAAGHTALIAACDIILSLHRSEGLGLVPAEAMMLGKPVIATGWSGNMEFMDETSAALVGYSLIPAEDPRKVYHGAVWAEPDHDHAVAQLRRLADSAAERHALGARGQASVRRRLGVEPLKAALVDIGLTFQS
jgi:glycosyltransferase involved in cell wall biosynthesis